MCWESGQDSGFQDASNGSTSLQWTWLPKGDFDSSLCGSLPAATDKARKPPPLPETLEKVICCHRYWSSSKRRLGLSQPSGLPDVPVPGLFTSYVAWIKTAPPYQTEDFVPDTQGQNKNQFLIKAWKFTLSPLVALLSSRKVIKTNKRGRPSPLEINQGLAAIWKECIQEIWLNINKKSKICGILICPFPILFYKFLVVPTHNHS